MRRRLPRILLTTLVILLFTGYFAFSTLFFSPLEGRFEYDVSSLIPRDVDFYVAKADLEDDFDPLPRPAFADDFEGSEGGKAIGALPAYRDLLARLDVARLVDELNRTLEGLPVKVDPLQVFGGRDLAITGYVRGSDLASSDWIAYGRCNWMGKLAFELLSFPGAIGLDAQGLSVTREEGVYTLSGGQLSRPLHLTRIQDVLIAGTSAEAVGQVASLEATRGENSFGQSAKYHDHVVLESTGSSPLEFYVDYARVAGALGWPGDVPRRDSEVFSTALLGRLFQLAYVRELIGFATFANGIALRAHAMLDSERMTGTQKRLYRLRGFERAEVESLARLAPADTGVFFAARLGVGDLLRDALDAADRDTRGLITDQVREVWGYADAQPLIDDLDAALQDRIGVVVRDYDYPDEGESGPPHNDRVVPAWAVVLWIKDKARLDEITRRIQARPDAFAISGREPGSGGIFQNLVGGGARVFEYWSQLIDGTGHLATLEDRFGQRDGFIVSNSHQMLGHMHSTFFDLDGTHPCLADTPWFQTQLGAGLQTANLVLWVAPRAIDTTLRGIAMQTAEEGVVIDWQVERPRIERKILKEQFAGKDARSLSPEDEQRLEALYQAEADRFQREFEAQHVPALRQDFERRIAALEALEGLLLELSTDQKYLQLFLRVVTPFDS